MWKIFFLLAFFSFPIENNAKYPNYIPVSLLFSDFNKLETELWEIFDNKSIKNNEKEDTLLEKILQFQNDHEIIRSADIWGNTQAPSVFFKLEIALHLPDYKRFHYMHTLLHEIYYEILSKLESKNGTLEDMVELKFKLNPFKKGLKTLLYGLVLKEISKKVSKDVEFHCDSSHQSPHQAYSQLYNIVSVTQLRAYIIETIACLMSSIYKKDFNKEEIRKNREEFEVTVNTTKADFLKAMQKANNQIWHCDPTQHIKGHTYENVSIFHGYVINEEDMASEEQHGKGKCDKSCIDITTTKERNCSYGYCNGLRRCKGNLVLCKKMSAKISVCPIKDHDPEPYKLYQYYFNHKEHKKYGSGTCRSKELTLVNHRKQGHDCDFCWCYCDDKNLNTIVDLRTTTADIGRNKVVTGVRFVLKDNVLYLQLQQGVLLPNGFIDTGSVGWKPLNLLNRNKAVEGRDYLALTLNRQQMMMDTVEIPESDAVITGFKINTVEDGDDTKMFLEILYYKFKLNTAYLIGNPKRFSKGIHPQAVKFNKRQNLPIRAYRNVPYEVPNAIVTLVGTSDYDDAAQNTVPFFDIRPVQSVPPLPLQSLGWIVRYQSGYSGFIAPTIGTRRMEPFEEN